MKISRYSMRKKMIRYTLRCDDCNHHFDEWFDNMSDYETKQTVLHCPSCGGSRIAKAIMAPKLGKGSGATPPPPGSCNPKGCGQVNCQHFHNKVE
jgi:predicted nucleic acid-binding Zn ribbon protein